MVPITLAALNAMNRESFVAALGGIFESSPWVAEGAYRARPFASVDELHEAMLEVVRTAGEERQLELIRAHPDLAGRAALAGEVAESSSIEQRGVRLDRLSPEEYRRFHELNEGYRSRFGFPFILAVKGHDKRSILAAFEARIKNDPIEERARALSEIAKIAHFRLNSLIIA